MATYDRHLYVFGGAADNNLSNDVSSELVEHFGERVYRTVIPRNVALAEAPSHGQSILKYSKNIDCRDMFFFKVP